MCARGLTWCGSGYLCRACVIVCLSRLSVACSEGWGLTPVTCFEGVLVGSGEGACGLRGGCLWVTGRVLVGYGEGA